MPSGPEPGSVTLPASCAVRLPGLMCHRVIRPLAHAIARVQPPPNDMPQMAGLPWLAVGIAAAFRPGTLHSSALPLTVAAARTLPSPLKASPRTASQIPLTLHEPPGRENVAGKAPDATSHRYTWPP